MKNPFTLDDPSVYKAWRDTKLSHPPLPDWIKLSNNGQLSDAQKIAIQASCHKNSFARFRFDTPPADPELSLRNLGYALNLQDIDANLCAEDSGLTAITVKDTHTSNAYIPYTNKPLGWHTDGYYNDMAHQIHGWLLYCGQPAQHGGINQIMDHEIAYIRVRDENPDWIRALMAPDAFTIPPNIEGGKEIRPAHSGPVFSVSTDGMHLHMRYSARQRNIIWKDDTATQEAAAYLLQLLKGDDPFVVQMRLEKGEGVISNNILHNRSGFTDSDTPALKRVIYRARYYDRISVPAQAI